MKKTILAIGLLIFIGCGNLSAQKKDSITYLPDSVNSISLVDIQKVLENMSDKISKKEWDMWLRAFQTLAATTEEKRKVHPKGKN